MSTEPEMAETETEETEAQEQPDPAIAELEGKWRRALADIDNLRKRHARELAGEQAAERARTSAAFLPVVDNLDLALAHAEDTDDPMTAGVRAVRDQAVALLVALGFPRDEETGIRFDPARHEAVGVVEDPDAEPGTVVKVVRPGYQPLRPAAVIVAEG